MLFKENSTCIPKTKLDKISKISSKANEQCIQIAAFIIDYGNNFLYLINNANYFKKWVRIVTYIKWFIEYTLHPKERQAYKVTFTQKELDDALYEIVCIVQSIFVFKKHCLYRNFYLATENKSRSI